MQALLSEIEAVPALRRFGCVARIEGLLVEVTGAAGAVSLGGQVRLSSASGKRILCEVGGFRDGRAQIMPLGSLDRVSLGGRADFEFPQIEAFLSQKKEEKAPLALRCATPERIFANVRSAPA